MIEISQLQTLVAVTRASSFSKAAEKLEVTQSAISQSIKNIENKLEVKLFKRSGKRVLLTPEGEQLFRLASGFLGNMEKTLEQIKYNRFEVAGSIRIGTLTGIGKSWLAPKLLQMGSEYPELTVALNLGFQGEIVRGFENNEFDIVVLPDEFMPTFSERICIGEEICVLVYPNDGDYNITPETTLEELASYPTILFQEKGDGLYAKWCLERFGRVSKTVNKKYIINSHGNILQAVQKGLGVAVVPEHVLARSYYKDKVRVFDQVKVSNGHLYAFYHKESLDLMRVRKALEVLTERSSGPLSTGSFHAYN